MLIAPSILPQVIHSDAGELYRFSGSSGVSAAQGLWIDLWKLWIAPKLLDRDLNVM